jgi:TRAP-type C4-dicarboxylate transport system substrate-binding protein
MTMRLGSIRGLVAGTAVAAFTLVGIGMTGAASAKELTLSYFMGPKHPMNAAVFTPFAEKLAEVSGGALTVKQFAGGALNSAPPRQYSILLEGVADVAFGLPGYTSQLFPITNVLTVPGVAADAVKGTEALWNAMALIEKEYDAKVLAMWANAGPVLITKDKPIRTLEDLRGMKVRVTSAQDVPFVEALGATAVSQPVTVINQNLTNGTIDAIAIDPSAIGSFKLWEPANFITVGMPGSGSAFFLLMNKETWAALTPQEQAWVDEASGKALSLSGGTAYKASAARGLSIAADNGVEVILLSASEVARFEAAMKPAMDTFLASKVSGDLTGGEIVRLMQGN